VRRPVDIRRGQTAERIEGRRVGAAGLAEARRGCPGRQENKTVERGADRQESRAECKR
jgi:hypothetical protein